ncbi:MAG: glycosyltransferase family 4 protein [Halobacteriota archaeon]|nr:glycosyltransferase family 4 protein [Halobacteriota archaeon]
MKIAQVCHRYYPNIGGVETHVMKISERLAKNHDVKVISADLSSEKSRNEEIEGVRIKRFRSISPNDAYFIAPQIYFYLKKSDFDLIHAHNYHSIPALFASLVKDTKFLFTPHYHGMGSTPLRDNLNKPYRLLGSRIFDRANKIICVSDYEKDLVIKSFGIGDTDVVVIPNGVDIDEISKAKPFEFDGDLILYVGRLDKYKNIHLAIKAMEFLSDSYFYIIGNGNYKMELDELINRLNLGERVKILSNVSDEEKYRWMKTCSLFINLSGIEAFGMTVIEALAAEKAVIVNERGGLKELAEKFDGVSPTNVEETSVEKLARMIEEKMGERVKIDLSKYDWGNVAKRIEDVYLGVLGGDEYGDR